MILYDIYIFKEKFQKADIFEFIDTYNLTPLEDFYEYPKYENIAIFDTNKFIEMLEFVLKLAGGEYTFYFDAQEKVEYKQGIIQIYDDESICLGLGVLPEYEKKYIDELKQHYNTKNVFVCYHVPPPMYSSDVRALLNHTTNKSL